MRPKISDTTDVFMYFGKNSYHAKFIVNHGFLISESKVLFSQLIKDNASTWIYSTRYSPIKSLSNNKLLFSSFVIFETFAHIHEYN